MDEYAKANKKNWNGRVPAHLQSRFYDVVGFKRGETSLKKLEIKELGSVRNKSLLHLQCHFGQDTISWARLGAKSTGVDFSDKAIKVARDLARETGTQARFICSDIYDLPGVLKEKFDIVFASYGVFCWISDINRWMRVARSCLKPGGILYLMDDHPFASMFDKDGRLILYPYFPGKPIKSLHGGTYTDGDLSDLPATYEWSHTIGDIVNAVISNGMGIDFLHEFDFCAWKKFRTMKQGKNGFYTQGGTGNKLPLLFSLKAHCGF